VNLPGGGAAHGMTVLAPGESLTREFSFTVERSGEAKRRGRPKQPAGQKARKTAAAVR
jgi:aldose 1-epimerase